MVQSLFNIFARSPIHPLQTHMEKVQACVSHLLPFFKSVLEHDWQRAEHYQQQVSELEKTADDIKKDIRMHLPNSLFLPFARADLLSLLSRQDKIANKAKDIAGLVLGRKIQFPKSLQQALLDYVERNIDACQQALKAIEELDELLETSFRGRSVTFVSELLDKLDQIEDDTDVQQRELRASLFAIEQDLQPVQVVFMYHIIDNIGDLADHSQSVGGQLQLIMAR